MKTPIAYVFLALVLLGPLQAAETQTKTDSGSKKSLIRDINDKRYALAEELQKLESDVAASQHRFGELKNALNYDNEKEDTESLALLEKALSKPAELSPTEKERVQAKVAQYKDDRNYQYTSSDLIKEIQYLHDSLDRSKREKDEKIELEKTLSGKIERLAKTKADERNLTYKLEEAIGSVDQENLFRQNVSLAFCCLVSLVIFLFYYVVLKRGTKSDIFAGETGIQFIALFLLIIAIVLFGIMGILEGKELSALLGGLSGYILGRNSRATDTRSPEKETPVVNAQG